MVNLFAMANNLNISFIIAVAIALPLVGYFLYLVITGAIKLTERT